MVEIEIIKAIQTLTCGFSDFLFILITLFGEEFLISVVFAIIYFSVDKRLGKQLGYCLFSSICFNTIVKDIVREPRPFHTPNTGIRSIFTDTATGYSFPSGHSQGAATTYSVIAMGLKKRWAWIACGALVFLVGISRLYLGVHWPVDVLCGWLFGLAFAFAMSYAYKVWGNWVGLAAVLFLPALFFLSAPDVFKGYGMFAGFCVSVPLEEKFIDFPMDIPRWKKIVRLFAGLGYIIAIKLLFDWIFPAGNVLDLIKYFLLSFLGFFVYPLIFTKCKF